MKNLLIRLGLWEEIIEEQNFYEISHEEYTLLVNAKLHFCQPCARWFGDTRGKLMHDRHRHKNA